MKQPLLVRAARAWAFARHMPISKLARRFELTLKRTAFDHVPVGVHQSKASPTQLAAHAHPPLPVFAPRRAGLVITATHLQFTFINATMSMPRDAIDWRATGPGRSHQLWNMNLHYMEYLESAPDDVFCALIDSWIGHNPRSALRSWRDSWNSYALSLRTLVWMQQLAVRRPRLTAAFVQRTHASLIEQLSFLMANLETDLGGNHLIKNIKALLWASRYFEGAQADRWRTRALTLLERELAIQILPDGMHDERSPSYHCQIFADLLECRHVLGSDLTADPAALAAANTLDLLLPNMAHSMIATTHPDGQVALFNDAGLNMAYAPRDCLDTFERLGYARPARTAVSALTASGYYGLHTSQSTLIVDCGRIAPDDLPAHGHGDVLSFELSVGDQRMIVDQGVFEYLAGERRKCARAASSHNTLCFDGADQADFFGAFRCGRRPNVTVRHYQASVDGFILEGTHDGFANLPGAPRHIRRFDATPQILTITDTIEGTRNQLASIAFLLHPDASPALTAQGATITRNGATIELRSDLPVTLEPAVWWPDMGHEMPTIRLRLLVPPHLSQTTTQLEFHPAATSLEA